ncbi:hypothetical protein LTR08_004818 [Meristemomyces frigidus]|nr:hypothetical protein LTR08_004818 [Meristemomyces frigidus]
MNRPLPRRPRITGRASAFASQSQSPSSSKLPRDDEVQEWEPWDAQAVRYLDRDGLSGEEQQRNGQPNVVGIKGVDYYLTTELDDAFVHDLLNMAADEMIAKYGLVETGDVEVDAPGEPQTAHTKIPLKCGDASRAA